jgi:hypothetical protein
MQSSRLAALSVAVGLLVSIANCSTKTESHGDVSEDAQSRGLSVGYEVRRIEGGPGDSTQLFDLIIHGIPRETIRGHIRGIVVESEQSKGHHYRVSRPDSGVTNDTTVVYSKHYIQK